MKLMICTISLNFEIDFLEFPLEFVFVENLKISKTLRVANAKLLKEVIMS